MARPEVVVVGAGPAGLAAVREMLDRPWRRGRVAVRVRRALVNHVDLHRRVVETDTDDLRYDYLVLAAGAADASEFQPGISRAARLRDLADALSLRDHLLRCLEAAAWATDPAARARQLSVAVIGAGHSGAELAAALPGILRTLAGRDVAAGQPGEFTVTLVEAAGSVLPGAGPAASAATAGALREAGVRLVTGRRVVDVNAGGAVLEDGDRVDAATPVSAAGLRASPLAGALPATGSAGRVIVNPTLQVERHPEVFVVGDMAEIRGPAGPLPMTAPVAIQAGRRVGRSVRALAAGGHARRFRYREMVVPCSSEQAGAAPPGAVPGEAGVTAWLVSLAAQVVPTLGARRLPLVLARLGSAYLLGRRRAPISVPYMPVMPAPAPGGSRPGHPVLGPHAVPAAGTRTDLPSVNVGNADRWGPVAALAWWTQDLPKSRPEGPGDHGLIATIRRRATKLRHEITGNKSQTTDNYRG